MDAEIDVVMVGDVRRLSKQEAMWIRGVQAQGQAVVFASRHQWRHFQRHP